MIPRAAGRWPIRATLAAILLSALWLRLQAVNFGLPALLDPDEPIFLMLGFKLIKNQTLNPGWFGHPGTTTIYCLALVELATYALGWLTGRFAGPADFAHAIYQDPSIVFLPGRLFIVACGLLTIWLTFLVARRLFGDRVALLSAFALAIDPQHIRYSQIIRTDMQATIFLLLVILAAIRIAQAGRRRDYILSGILLGLACATKWPAAACCVAVAGAAVLQWLRQPDRFRPILVNLILFGLVAIAALFIVSPFLLLDYQTVVNNLHGEERPFHLGATGHGLLGNIAWYLSGPLFQALGPFGLIGACAGFWLGCRRAPAFAATVLPVFLAFLVMVSVQALVWERWVVPLLPLASVALGVGLDASFAAMQRFWTRRVAWAGGLALFALVFAPVLVTARSFASERGHDTRTEATAWARAHIPAGSTVTVEHLAFDVLHQRWHFLFPGGDVGCINVRSNLDGEIDYRQIGQWRGNRAIVDIGTVAPAKLATCRGDWAIIMNWDRYRAEAKRFPGEVANYARFVRGGELVRTFSPVPGRIGGPVVRIIRFTKPSSDKSASDQADQVSDQSRSRL